MLEAVDEYRRLGVDRAIFRLPYAGASEVLLELDRIARLLKAANGNRPRLIRCIEREGGNPMTMELRITDLTKTYPTGCGRSTA